jgi:hypothetical protein
VTREWCPVGELAGDPHTYVAGDGVVIPWDVAGDPRSGVEACPECAVDHAPDENPPCDTCHYPASDHVAGACIVAS